MPTAALTCQPGFGPLRRKSPTAAQRSFMECSFTVRYGRGAICKLPLWMTGISKNRSSNYLNTEGLQRVETGPAVITATISLALILLCVVKRHKHVNYRIRIAYLINSHTGYYEQLKATTKSYDKDFLNVFYALANSALKALQYV